MNIDTDGSVLSKMKRLTGDVQISDEDSSTTADDVKEWLATHSIDMKITNGLTLLQIAAKEGAYNTTLFLLNEGADWSVRHPTTGDTALHYATTHPESNILKLLADRGTPSCDVENSSAETPLSLVLSNFLMLQRSDENKKSTALKLLLDKTSPDTVFRIVTRFLKNNTVAGIQVLIETATTSGNSKIVNLIVTCLERSNKTIAMDSVMLKAIKKNDLTILNMLCSSTITFDQDRSEALAMALQYGNNIVIDMLRQLQVTQQSGQRVSRTSSSGKRTSIGQEVDFISTSQEYAQHAIVSRLYNYISDGSPRNINSLLATVKTDNKTLGSVACSPASGEKFTILTTLFNKGKASKGDSNSPNSNGNFNENTYDAYFTAFVSLIGVSDPEAVEKFLEETNIGGDIVIDSICYFNQTLLYTAVCSGNSSVASLLIEKGADVDFPGPQQSTPLHAAVAAHSDILVELLLSKNADSSVANVFGESPLTCALSSRTRVPDSIIHSLLLRSNVDILRDCIDTNTESSNDTSQLLLKYAIQYSILNSVKVLTQGLRIPVNKEIVVQNRSMPLYFQDLGVSQITDQVTNSSSMKSMSGSMPQLVNSESPQLKDAVESVDFRSRCASPPRLSEEFSSEVVTSFCSPLFLSLISSIPDGQLDFGSESQQTDRKEVVIFLLSIGAHLSPAECEAVATQLEDTSATPAVTTAIWKIFKNPDHRQTLTQQLCRHGSSIAAAALLGGYDCALGDVLRFEQQSVAEGISPSSVVEKLSSNSLSHYLSVIGPDHFNFLYPISDSSSTSGDIQWCTLAHLILLLNYSKIENGDKLFDDCVSVLLTFGIKFDTLGYTGDGNLTAETTALENSIQQLPNNILTKIIPSVVNVSVKLLSGLCGNDILTDVEKGSCFVDLLLKSVISTLEELSFGDFKKIMLLTVANKDPHIINNLKSVIPKAIIALKSLGSSSEIVSFTKSLIKQTEDIGVVEVIIASLLSTGMIEKNDIEKYISKNELINLKWYCDSTSSTNDLVGNLSIEKSRMVISHSTVNKKNIDTTDMCVVNLSTVTVILSSMGVVGLLSKFDIFCSKELINRHRDIIIAAHDSIKSLQQSFETVALEERDAFNNWIQKSSTDLLIVSSSTASSNSCLGILAAVSSVPDTILFEISLHGINNNNNFCLSTELFKDFDDPMRIGTDIALRFGKGNIFIVLSGGGDSIAISSLIKQLKTNPKSILEKNCRFIWYSDDLISIDSSAATTIVCRGDPEEDLCGGNSNELLATALQLSYFNCLKSDENYSKATLSQLVMTRNNIPTFRNNKKRLNLVASHIVDSAVCDDSDFPPEVLLHNPSSILLQECIEMASTRLISPSYYENLSSSLTSVELCNKSRGGILSLLCASEFSLDRFVLNNLTFELANLTDATIIGASFRNCVFLNCEFKNCTFACCDITSAVFLPLSLGTGRPVFLNCENLSVAPAINPCHGVSRESLMQPNSELVEKNDDSGNRTYAVLTPDKRLVCVSGEKGVDIWEIESGRKWVSIPTAGTVDEVLSHDLGGNGTGHTSIILSTSGNIEVWELASRANQVHTKNHEEITKHNSIPCMAILNGVLYYSESGNINKLKIRSNGKLLAIRGISSIKTCHTSGEDGRIVQMCASPVTNSIVTLGEDGVVTVLDTVAFQSLLLEPKLTTKPFSTRRIAVTGCFILIAHNCNLKIWHHEINRSSLTLVDHEKYCSQITELSAASIGTQYVVSMNNGCVSLTDYSCGRRVPLVAIPMSGVGRSISVFETGELMLICTPSDIQIKTLPHGILKSSVSRNGIAGNSFSEISGTSLHKTENLLSTEAYLKAATLGYSHAAYKLLAKSTLSHNECTKLVESLPTTSQKRVAKGKLRKKEAEAKRCFELAIEIDPEKICSSARIELGKLLQSRTVEQRRLFREAIAMDVNNSDAYLELANSLGPKETTELPNCTERFKRIDLIRIAIARNPLDPKPYFELAVMMGTKSSITLFSKLFINDRLTQKVTKQDLLNQVLELDINLELYLVLEERGIEDDVLLPQYRNAYLTMLEEDFKESCKEGIRTEDIDSVREVMIKQANRYHKHPDRYTSYFDNIKQHFEDALTLAKRRPLSISNAHYSIAFYILGYLSDADRVTAVSELSEFVEAFSTNILFGTYGHSAVTLIEHYHPHIETVQNGRTPLQYAALNGWYQVCKILLGTPGYIEYERTAGDASALFYAVVGLKDHSATELDFTATIAVLCSSSVIPLRYIKESSEACLDDPLTSGSHTLLYFLLTSSCDEAVQQLLKRGSDPGTEVSSRDGKTEPLLAAALRDRHTRALENQQITPLSGSTAMCLLESAVKKSNLDLCTLVSTNFKNLLQNFQVPDGISSPVETALRERKPAPLCLFLVQELSELVPSPNVALSLAVAYFEDCVDGNKLCQDYRSLVREIHTHNKVILGDAEATVLLCRIVVEYAKQHDKLFIPMTVALGVREVQVVWELQCDLTTASFRTWMAEEVLSDIGEEISNECYKITSKEWGDINFALSFFAAFHSTDPPQDKYLKTESYRKFISRLSMDSSYPKLLFGSTRINAQYLRDTAMVNLDSFLFSVDGYRTLLISSIHNQEWDKFQYLLQEVDCNVLTADGGALSALYCQAGKCCETTYQNMVNLIVGKCNRIVLDDLNTRYPDIQGKVEYSNLCNTIIKQGNLSMLEALVIDYNMDPRLDDESLDCNLFLIGWKEHVSQSETIDDSVVRPPPTRLKAILWLFAHQMQHGIKPHETVMSIVSDLQAEYLGDYQDWFGSSIQHVLKIFAMCGNTAVVMHLLPSYMGDKNWLSRKLFNIAVENKAIGTSLFLLSVLDNKNAGEAVQLYTSDHLDELREHFNNDTETSINNPAAVNKTLLQLAIENTNTPLASTCIQLGATATVAITQLAISKKMLIEGKQLLSLIQKDIIDGYEMEMLSNSTNTLLVTLCCANQELSAPHQSQKVISDILAAMISQVLQCTVWQRQFKQLVEELQLLANQLGRSCSGRHLTEFDKLPPRPPGVAAYISREQCVELRQLRTLKDDYDPAFRAMYSKISDKITAMLDHDAYEDWAPPLISTGWEDSIEMLHACVISAEIFESVHSNDSIVESIRYRLTEFKKRLPKSISISNILSTGYTELLASLDPVPVGVICQAISIDDLAVYSEFITDSEGVSSGRPTHFIKIIKAQTSMLVLDTSNENFIKVVQDGVTGWVSRSAVNEIPLHVYDKTVMRVQVILSEISPPIPIHSCFEQTIKKGAITYNYVLILQPILRRGDSPKDRVINQCSKQIRELINKKWIETEGAGNIFICGIGTGQTGGNAYCSAEVSRLQSENAKHQVDSELYTKISVALRQLIYIERLCNSVTVGNSEEGKEVTVDGDVHLKLLGIKNKATEHYKSLHSEMYKQTERLLTAPDHNGVVCAKPLQIPPRASIRDNTLEVDTVIYSLTSQLVVRSGPSRVHPHLATIEIGATITVVQDYSFTGGRGSSEEHWYYILSSNPKAKLSDTNVNQIGQTKKGHVEGFILFNELKSLFAPQQDTETQQHQTEASNTPTSTLSLSDGLLGEQFMQAPPGITHQVIFLRETPLFISETSDRVIPCVGKQWAPALVLRDIEGCSRVSVLSHYKSPVKYQGWANRSDIRVLRLPFVDDFCRQILRKLDESRTQNLLLENFVIHSAFKLHNNKICFIVMPNFRQKGDQVTHMYPKINKGWEKVIEGEAVEVRTYHENEHRISEAFEKAGLSSRRENENSGSSIENVKHRLSTYAEGLSEVVNMVRGCCPLDPTGALEAVHKLVTDLEEFPSPEVDLLEQDDGLGRVCYDPMGMEPTRNIDTPGVALVPLQLLQATPIYDRPSNVTFPRGVLPEHTTVYLQERKSYLSNADNLEELWGFVRTIALPQTQRLNQSDNINNNKVSGWIDLAKIADSAVKDQVRDNESRLLNKKLLVAATDRRTNPQGGQQGQGANSAKSTRQQLASTSEIPIAVEPAAVEGNEYMHPASHQIVAGNVVDYHKQQQLTHHSLPKSPSKHLKQQHPVQQMMLDDNSPDQHNDVDSRRNFFGTSIRNLKNGQPAPNSRK